MCKNETMSIFWDSSDEEEGSQRSNRSKPRAVKVEETLYIDSGRHPSISLNSRSIYSPYTFLFMSPSTETS